MNKLTYNEFKNRIQTKTHNYIYNACRYFKNYYDFSISSKEIKKAKEKRFYKMIAALADDERYSYLLSKNNISKVNFNDIGQERFEEQIFNTFAEWFMLFNNEEELLVLNPPKILSHYLTVFKENDPENADKLFKCLTKVKYEDFISDLNKAALTEAKEDTEKINKEYFKNARLEVISFLEMVGKIFIYLRMYKEQIPLISEDIDQIKAISIFISLFLYDDVNTDFNTKNVLANYFNKIGLTKDVIETALGIKIDIDMIKLLDPSLVLKYYFDEFTINNSVTVEKIFETYFSQNNYRVSILKLLNACKIDDDEITNALNYVKTERNEYNTISIDELYKNVNSTVISYYNLSCKTYQYLISSYDKLSKDLIQNKYDIKTIAMLIASYFMNGYLSSYFIDNAISLENISSLLNIKIDKVEIEKITLDEKLLAREFDTLIEYTKSGNIEDVTKILTNSTKVNLTVIERIYSLCLNEKLPSNLVQTIDNHNKEKMAKIKKEAEEKLFLGLDIEIYNFFVIVSKFYQSLKKMHPNIVFSYDELKFFSVLFALCNYDDRFKNYLSSIGLSHKTLSDYLNIHPQIDNNNIIDDISIIQNYYAEYIFGFNNKDKKREEITLESIINNIFSYSLPINVNKYFYAKNISTKDLFDIKEKIAIQEKREAEKQEKERKEKAKKELNNSINEIQIYSFNIYKILMNISGIMAYLFEKSSVGEYIYINVSILLAFLLSDNKNVKFFTKNGLTLEKLVDYYKLDLDELSKYPNNGKEYLKNNPNIQSRVIGCIFKDLKVDYNIINRTNDIYEVVMHLFYSSNIDTKVLPKICAALDVDYNTLKEEMTSQKEVERPLTKDELLDKLMNGKIPDLVVDDIKNLSTYGDELTVHANLIGDEWRKLALSDSSEPSLGQINELVNNLYSTEPALTKPLTFFERLIGKEEKIVEPEKTVVNENAVHEIKEKINQNIEVLTNEIVGFDYIRKYLEVYLKRLEEYIKITSLELKKEKDKLSSLPNDDEHYALMLNQSTIIKILEDKLNRFKTSYTLSKQELLKVHMRIVNHFITQNALKTSRDDILPLVGSEMLLLIGTETENNALELSNSIVSLFHSVLEKNAESTKVNLEKLKQTNLPDSTIERLQEDINLYLKGITSLDIKEEVEDRLSSPDEQTDKPSNENSIPDVSGEINAAYTDEEKKKNPDDVGHIKTLKI